MVLIKNYSSSTITNNFYFIIIIWNYILSFTIIYLGYYFAINVIMIINVVNTCISYYFDTIMEYVIVINNFNSFKYIGLLIDFYFFIKNIYIFFNCSALISLPHLYFINTIYSDNNFYLNPFINIYIMFRYKLFINIILFI